MSISERLQMVIKMNGMTNASFADEIGVQRSSISHVLAGRNKPSIDFIQKILITFPKVNADWLITGKRIGKSVNTAEKATISTTERLFKDEQSSSQSINEEERGKYNESTAGVEAKTSTDQPSVLRKISKVLIFYTDGTFEESIPQQP